MRLMQCRSSGVAGDVRINPRYVTGLYTPSYSTDDDPVTCVTALVGDECNWHVKGTVAEIEAEWAAAMKESP